MLFFVHDVWDTAGFLFLRLCPYLFFHRWQQNNGTVLGTEPVRLHLDDVIGLGSVEQAAGQHAPALHFKLVAVLAKEPAEKAGIGDAFQRRRAEVRPGDTSAPCPAGRSQARFGHRWCRPAPRRVSDGPAAATDLVVFGLRGRCGSSAANIGILLLLLPPLALLAHCTRADSPQRAAHSGLALRVPALGTCL